MKSSRFLASLAVVASLGALLLAQPKGDAPSGAAMTAAANSFLGTLDEAHKARATFGYDDAERLNWYFIPRPRKGLPIKDMSEASVKAAHQLIAGGLSQAGYEQALNVMSLEELLYLLEAGDRSQRRQRRDPLNYYISIFGTPHDRGTWGWRLEGHHLSLNYTITNNQVGSSTPEFFGANPGRVDAGPGRAIRVLGTEEDLARQIVRLASPEQRALLWIDKTAPEDVRGANKLQPEITDPVGLSADKLSPDQKQLLAQLLDEYLKNMPDDVSRSRRSDLEKAQPEEIYFAWWGSIEPNEPHYYRVQGPSFIIEYNNVQNNANHVHSMWRSLAGDFNLPRESR